jgi:hypothetical protein
MRLQMQIGLETYISSSQGKPSLLTIYVAHVLCVHVISMYYIMSLSAHGLYFQTTQEALLNCNIILEKYGSDDGNIGEWRSC